MLYRAFKFFNLKLAKSKFKKISNVDIYILRKFFKLFLLIFQSGFFIFFIAYCIEISPL